MSRINIRRPDLLGVTDVAQLAQKVTDSIEDIIRAVERDDGSLDQEVRTMEWAEDGAKKSVLTQVQFPQVVVAVAKVQKAAGTTVATGSVSFEMDGTGNIDEGWGMWIHDISGLSTGTDYDVSLFIVGEV